MKHLVFGDVRIAGEDIDTHYIEIVKRTDTVYASIEVKLHKRAPLPYFMAHRAFAFCLLPERVPEFMYWWCAEEGDFIVSRAK